ncbi:MAG: hypothetical protein WCA35_04470 [Kovacikia sp.]
MTSQRDFGRSTLLLLTISAAVAYVTTYIGISFNSALSAPTQPLSAPLPFSEGSFVEVSSNPSCRRVLGNGFPLYAEAGQAANYLQSVQAGQQVGLENGTKTILGEDGLPYIYVSVPYGSQNPTLGYMQSQVKDAASGDLQSTLAMCASSNELNNGSGNSNNGDSFSSSGQRAVRASW